MVTDTFHRKLHRLDAVIAVTEPKLQNGGGVPMALELSVMRVVCTTLN